MKYLCGRYGCRSSALLHTNISTLYTKILYDTYLKQRYCAKHIYVKFSLKKKVHRSFNKLCSFITCDKYGNFMHPSKAGKYCSKHRPDPSYTHSCRVQCKKFVAGIQCARNAICGENGVYEYCILHNASIYTDAVSRLCDTCNKIGYYKSTNTGKRYCTVHKPTDAIHLYNEICDVNGCSNLAKYKILDSKKKYCFKHKPTENYIDSSALLCKIDKCGVIASFGLKYGQREYCFKHKPSPLYINKKNTICKVVTCLNTATYGKLPNMPKYCSKHKPSSYINKLVKLCKYGTCTTVASYRKKGDINKYCAKHKPSSSYIYI